jgi:hypothetical protein
VFCPRTRPGQVLESAVLAICFDPCLQVLYELVESLRTPDKIVCAIKGPPPARRQPLMVAQRSNPFLNRESALYERFLDTLARHSQDLKCR